MAVVIGEDYGGRQGHEQRRDGVVLAVPVHRHDGGCRFAVNEAGEEAKFSKRPEVSASKAARCSAVMLVMARLTL